MEAAAPPNPPGATGRSAVLALQAGQQIGDGVPEMRCDQDRGPARELSS